MANMRKKKKHKKKKVSSALSPKARRKARVHDLKRNRDCGQHGRGDHNRYGFTTIHRISIYNSYKKKIETELKRKEKQNQTQK